MNCNFYPPVQICNVSNDMIINSKLISRLEDCSVKNNLFDPRPLSSRCCNYLNNSYNNLKSSCCFKNEDIKSLNKKELENLKNGTKYQPYISDIYNKYSIIDFNIETKDNINHIIDNKITDKNLIETYTNQSEDFKSSLKENKLFNKSTKNKLKNI